MFDVDILFGDISGNRMLMAMDPLAMKNWILSLATTTITLCKALRIDKYGDGYEKNVYSFNGMLELDETVRECWDGNHDASVCCMLDSNARVLKAFEKSVTKNNRFEYTHLLYHLGRNGEPVFMLIVKALEGFQKFYESSYTGNYPVNFCEYNESFIEVMKQGGSSGCQGSCGKTDYFT